MHHCKIVNVFFGLIVSVYNYVCTFKLLILRSFLLCRKVPRIVQKTFVFYPDP